MQQRQGLAALGLKKLLPLGDSDTTGQDAPVGKTLPGAPALGHSGSDATTKPRDGGIGQAPTGRRLGIEWSAGRSLWNGLPQLQSIES